MNDFFEILDDFEITDFTGSGGNDHFNLDIEGDASGGTEYNDYIENRRDNMFIQALGGDDTIDNSGSEVIILGNKGNDLIFNTGERVLIAGGDGDDTISNSGSNVVIFGGEGNDSIDNDDGSNVSISGGSGNDTIANYDNSSNVSINGGVGDDSVLNGGSDVTQDGGDGDDYIWNKGENAKILGGDGDDTVDNSGGSNSSIDGGAGDDYVDNYGKNVSINGGGGDDTIRSYGENTTIDGGAGNDYFFNSASKVTIFGGDGNDTIEADGYNLNNLKIDGGDGNDTIGSYGSNVSINGGTGNDTIYSSGSNVTIDGGTGNDTIDNSGLNVSIDGGAGNDSIRNFGSKISINGGAGNDYISLGAAAANNVIEYKSGDGNDLIVGFNATSNLQIAGGTGTYSHTISGSDVIVTVGKGKITLSGAASLSSVNINGEGISNNIWRLNGTTATYGTTKKTLITVKGVKSLAGLSVNGTTVTIGEASLDKKKTVTVSKGYTLKLGDDVTQSEGVVATYKNGVYKTKGISAGFKLANNKISYTESNTKSFTFSGVADGATAKSFYVSGNKIAIGKGAIKDDGTAIKLVSASDGGNYTLRLGSNMDSSKTLTAAEYDSKTKTYRTKGTTAVGYEVSSDGKSITYHDTATSKSFTFSGVADGATAKSFYVSGNKIAIGKVAIKDDGTAIKLVSASDGGNYTLRLGSNMDSSKTLTAAEYDSKTMTYRTKGTTAVGYEVSSNGKSITYHDTATSKSFTFSGVADGATAKSFYVSGNKIAIGKVAIKDDGTAIKLVSASDGKDYTLRLGSSMTSSRTLTAAEYDSKTMTYRTKGTTAVGYEVSSDGKSITYHDTATSKSFTFTGLTKKATADDFTVNAKTKTVAIKKEAVATNGTVAKLTTAPAGYKLALGSDMTAAVNSEATYTAKTQTYTSAGITKAGYQLGSDGKSVSYQKATALTFKFTGLTKKATADDFTVNAKAKTVAIKKEAVATNGTAAKLTTAPTGYKLKLGSDMTETSTVDSKWTFNDKKQTATYMGGGKTAGYTPAEDGKSITYSKKVAATALASISGIESSDGLTVKGDIVTITKGLSKNVSVGSDSYGFKFAQKGYTKAKITGTENNDSIIASVGSRMTIDSGDGEDSIIASGKYTSINSNLGDNYVELGAGAGNSTVQLGAGNDTVSNKAGSVLIETKGGRDVIINTGANATIDSGAGNDSIVSTGTDVMINGGAGADTLVGGAGNDTLSGGTGNDSLKGGEGADIFIYKNGEGNDIIADYNYDDGDIISLASGAISSSVLSGNNYIFTIGKGKLTVRNTKGKYIHFVDADENDIWPNGNPIPPVTIEGKKISVTESYMEDTFNVADYGSAFKTVDGSQVTHGLTINGYEKNAIRIIGTEEDDSISGGNAKDTLLGGDGNDSLNGGKGNDSLKGEAGADTFIYSNGDGNDIIADYEEEDTIKFAKGKVSKVLTASNGDVVFTVGSGKLTVQKAQDKIVTYEDAEGNRQFYPMNINAAGTAVTLMASYGKDEFNVADLGENASAIVTINASAVTHDLNITGNKLANNITGTEQNDSISGGAGADKLYGENGEDTLVGGKGNDSLWGGAGADTFIYSNGDGTDYIKDYQSGIDTIMILSGTMSNCGLDTSGNVFCKVGNGKVVVENAANKYVEFVDRAGNKKQYIPQG